MVKNLGGTQLGDSSAPHGVDQGHPLGSWAGVAGPRWRSTCQAPWQSRLEVGAPLGRLTGTPARGISSTAVSGELDILHGGWLYLQSKHPKRTVTLS